MIQITGDGMLYQRIQLQEHIQIYQMKVQDVKWRLFQRVIYYEHAVIKHNKVRRI